MRFTLVFLLLLSVCSFSAETISISAIINFSNAAGQTTTLSRYFVDEMAIKLTQNGSQLVDRAQIEKVLQEQAIQLSGTFDEATIAKIGKFTGATQIITGQYYPIGDQFQLMVSTIDVNTAKIVNMEKVLFPKSESLVKLDGVLINKAKVDNVKSTPVLSNTAKANIGGNGGNYLVIDRMWRDYWGTYISGSIQYPERGEITFINKKIVVIDSKGNQGRYSKHYLGSQEGKTKIFPNTKMKVTFFFHTKLEDVNFIEIPYKINDKEFLYASPNLGVKPEE